MYCSSLFVLFSFSIVLSVLPRFTNSDYPLSIFKLFFHLEDLNNSHNHSWIKHKYKSNNIWTKNFKHDIYGTILQITAGSFHLYVLENECYVYKPMRKRKILIKKKQCWLQNTQWQIFNAYLGQEQVQKYLQTIKNKFNNIYKPYTTSSTISTDHTEQV